MISGEGEAVDLAARVAVGDRVESWLAGLAEVREFGAEACDGLRL
jgi:hypothetical protein